MHYILLVLVLYGSFASCIHPSSDHVPESHGHPVHARPYPPQDTANVTSGAQVELYNNTGLGTLVPPQVCVSPGFHLSCLNMNSLQQLYGQSLRVTAMFTPSTSGLHDFALTLPSFQGLRLQFWADDHLVIDSMESGKNSSIASLPVRLPLRRPLLLRLQVAVVGTPTVASSSPGLITLLQQVSNATDQDRRGKTKNPEGWEPIPAAGLSPVLPSYHMKRLALQDQMSSQGWGTWWEANMLSFVNLPSGISLSLGFIDPTGANYSYAIHVPNQNKGTDGQPLYVRSGIATPDRSYINVNITWRQATFVVEASVSEEGAMTVMVSSNSTSTYTADFKITLTPDVKYQNLADFSWNTNSTILSATAPGLPPVEVKTSAPGGSTYPKISNATRIYPFTQAITWTTDTALSLSGVPAQIDRARRKAMLRYHRRVSSPVDSELRQGIEAAVTWNTAYVPQEGVITPVGRGPGWNFGAGYVLFEWDTYFLVIMAGEYVDKDIAYANAIQTTRGRTMQGFVPNYTSGEKKSRDRTEPVVASMAVWSLYQKYKDMWLLELLYDDLQDFNDWMWNRRSLVAGGIALMTLGSDPNIPDQSGSSTNAKEGAVLESGLDNSPMYDWPLGYDKQTHHLLLADVGVTALYINECDTLAEIGRALGRPDDEIQIFQNRSLQVSTAMRTHMWDAKDGIFKSVHYRQEGSQVKLEGFLPRISPANFYPLLTSVLAENEVVSICGYLQEKENFCISDQCKWSLPSIARWDLMFWEQNYWRGRIWGPMNFLVWVGLMRQGTSIPIATAVALRLSEQSGALFLQEWTEYRHIHENYNALTGQGGDRSDSYPFYHWGALLAYINVTTAETVLQGSNGEDVQRVQVRPRTGSKR